MLANLITEVRRRRLWPIPLVALLIAVAAPLLFLKSAPPDAPVASATAPAAAPEGKLPARAQRLLATTDIATGSSGRASGKASDPFEAPTSRGGSAAESSSADSGASAAATSAATQTAVTEPVPVVITNPDGTQLATTSPPIADGAAPTTTTSTGTSASGAMLVDVRFGEAIPGRLHRAIPRLQTFVAGGRIVAIFVKYSPRRDKAVFAIAPKTLVSGSIECRRKEDVCRYVDIPAGRGVRLTTLASDGSLVTRRLDVERIGRAAQTGASAATSTPPGDGACLLGKMLKLTATDPPLASDACQS